MSARKKFKIMPAPSYKNDVSFKAPLIAFAVWVVAAIVLTIICWRIGVGMESQNDQVVHRDPYNNYKIIPPTDYTAWFSAWNVNWWTAGIIIFALVFLFQGVRYWRIKRSQAKAS